MDSSCFTCSWICSSSRCQQLASSVPAPAVGSGAPASEQTSVEWERECQSFSSVHSSKINNLSHQNQHPLVCLSIHTSNPPINSPPVLLSLHPLIYSTIWPSIHLSIGPSICASTDSSQTLQAPPFTQSSTQSIHLQEHCVYPFIFHKTSATHLLTHLSSCPEHHPSILHQFLSIASPPYQFLHTHIHIPLH